MLVKWVEDISSIIPPSLVVKLCLTPGFIVITSLVHMYIFAIKVTTNFPYKI